MDVPAERRARGNDCRSDRSEMQRSIRCCVTTKWCNDPLQGHRLDQQAASDNRAGSLECNVQCRTRGHGNQSAQSWP